LVPIKKFFVQILENEKIFVGSSEKTFTFCFVGILIHNCNKYINIIIIIMIKLIVIIINYGYHCNIIIVLEAYGCLVDINPHTLHCSCISDDCHSLTQLLLEQPCLTAALRYSSIETISATITFMSL